MTACLPGPDWRCSAYWYAARAGMVSVPQAPGDLEFLRELGLRAASLARWEGIPAMTVPEGPYQVYLWPEHIWSAVADAMANYAAEHGGYGHSGDPAWESADGDPQGYGDPPSAANSRDPSCYRCNYDMHYCKGCGDTLPHGTEVCAACANAWGGRGPSASYRAWRDEGRVPVPRGDPEHPHGYWEAGDYS